MSKIEFDAEENQIASLYSEVRHRRALVDKVIERMDAIAAGDHGDFARYDDWYLTALQDGLFRRVFVVEYREWSRHIQDLIRDQLSRHGMDSGAWDELRATSGQGTFIDKVRRILADKLEAEPPEALWAELEEIRSVAETISHGTREARESLRERYPNYFTALDVFGDGDDTARLTLNKDHALQAFSTVEAFWSPETGLPHRVARGAA